jgi:hypothetical protein
MFDPRDDTRDRGEDSRERAYEGRDHTGDPRDVFLHDVDLPLEREREYVLDRDHVYELNGDDARTLATVGAFRVVPERELLDGDDAVSVSDSLDHLREQGLIETVPIGDHDQGIVLTDQGRDLLDANRRDRESDDDDGQAFHAGVLREREVEHDASMYEAFRAEELRIRDEHPGAEVHRVILEEDLKREYQEFLQEHNRDRPDSDVRPDRSDYEIERWAQEHDLPYFDEQVHFPDFRIELRGGRPRAPRGRRGADAALPGRPSIRPGQVRLPPLQFGRIRPQRRTVQRPSGRGPTGMSAPYTPFWVSLQPARIQAIHAFGFTERQARFLTHVLLFSGVFLERHYVECSIMRSAATVWPWRRHGSRARLRIIHRRSRKASRSSEALKRPAATAGASTRARARSFMAKSASR